MVSESESFATSFQIEVPDLSKQLQVSGRYEDQRTPSFVLTKPGWKLELDGSRSELVGYNHAFLGFLVPAGRHTAVLRYRPDGFVAGAAISGATLAVLLLFAFYRRISDFTERLRPSSTGA